MKMMLYLQITHNETNQMKDKGNHTSRQDDAIPI